jgi:uncharacterized protein YdeI (YjbR/CyaY-like superfamily)
MTCDAQTLDEWRAWLLRHHASAREVWLTFYKQHTGLPSVAYEDAVDEALCFGWIDSLIKRLDDRRYARKFTPRQAHSRWSASNRKRYEELRVAGRLTPAGINRAPSDGAENEVPKVPARVPAYIRNAFKKRPEAWRIFDGLAPSHQRRYVLWIHSAKREDTRIRRLEEAVRKLVTGAPLGLK